LQEIPTKTASDTESAPAAAADLPAVCATMRRRKVKETLENGAIARRIATCARHNAAVFRFTPWKMKGNQ
jgi:hypothetical protein